MSASSVYTDVFLIEKEKLNNGPFIGIDRGCSLTKVVLIPKKTISDDEKFYHVHCYSFLNKNFETALDCIREEAYGLETHPIRITGAGGDFYAKQIEEKLQQKCEFIDEFISQQTGAMFLVKNIPEKDLFLPALDISIEKPSFCGVPSASVSQRSYDVTLNDPAQQDSLLPIVFMFLGSGCGITVLKEGGKTKMPSGCMFAGKPLLGLANCILGTGDYKELTDLASKGTGQYDTTWGDILPSRSPYMEENKKNPWLFPFAKIADLTDEDEIKKEELALSIVRLNAMSLIGCLVGACRIFGVSRVVVGGNMARSEIIRTSFLEALSFYGLSDTLTVKFLRTGHTGAIGTMVAKIGGKLM